MKILRNKGKGFTWIGLLVVIGVTAIMVALSLPAINNARKKAQATRVGNATIAETRARVETEFPIEKILTISAAEYCKNQGKELQDYKLVGVQSMWSFYSFQESIPAGTEVVVGFTHSERSYAGTALILKDR